MARSVNKVILIGNLTRDPELRYTPQGHAVCTFGIATNREWVTNGEKQESADFHNIVAWNKLGELCSQLLKKGTKAFLEGRIQTRSWDGDDGVKRYKTEIVINEMLILTPKGSTGESFGNAPSSDGAKFEEASSEMPSDDEGTGEDISSEEVPF
ncbi:single-stranded DNA-binding protein [candidate division WWE3 bacterium]|jgi:single-strand DNA-binding protein|nr:single-stranded DNA-binding protein [candidate division WWE3 bacterium]MBT7350724.1 single-stranded DNA-binding protein [candidate division WWE3 bacterium]